MWRCLLNKSPILASEVEDVTTSDEYVIFPSIRQDDLA